LLVLFDKFVILKESYLHTRLPLLVVTRNWKATVGIVVKNIH